MCLCSDISPSLSSAATRQQPFSVIRYVTRMHLSSISCCLNLLSSRRFEKSSSPLSSLSTLLTLFLCHFQSICVVLSCFSLLLQSQFSLPLCSPFSLSIIAVFCSSVFIYLCCLLSLQSTNEFCFSKSMTSF